MQGVLSDLSGSTNGYLTAIRRVGTYGKGRISLWLVRCRCGRELRQSLTLFQFRNKRLPRSCGCARKEILSHSFKGIGNLSKSKWLAVLVHARKKGLPVRLTLRAAWRMFLKQKGRCALTGLPIVLNPRSMAAGANTASLDRIDSTKGYIPGNVQWVHVMMQGMKSNFPQAEFIEWCRLVTDHTRR